MNKVKDLAHNSQAPPWRKYLIRLLHLIRKTASNRHHATGRAKNCLEFGCIYAEKPGGEDDVRCRKGGCILNKEAQGFEKRQR